MYCPRLDHFVRFDANGKISKCGHMVKAPKFDSWNEMQSSVWLKNLKDQFESNIWPTECIRCRDSETAKNNSIRLDAIQRDRALSLINPNYIILSGVGDNICNSACQSCNANLSTKIGSLHGKNYIKINNYPLINTIPLEQVVEIDINGGEPTASVAYQSLIDHLPASVKVLRLNTNGSRVLKNLDRLLDRKIQVIVTLSLDGTGSVHDYVRWPIKWNDYQKTVDEYFNFSKRFSNLKLEAWTTLHTLNSGNFDSILSYCDSVGLDHSWAYLETPAPLNVKYSNTMSMSAKEKLSTHVDSRCRAASTFIATLQNNQDEFDQFVVKQDQLRKINIQDYL